MLVNDHTRLFFGEHSNQLTTGIRVRYENIEVTIVVLGLVSLMTDKVIR